MITLFENITEQLTDTEKEKLVPLMMHMLLNTKREMKVTAAAICTFLKFSGFNTSEPRVRKMVNYIRTTNLAKPKVLIGARYGYFLTDDVAIIDAQIESLQGRIDSMQGAIESIVAQKENLKH